MAQQFNKRGLGKTPAKPVIKRLGLMNFLDHTANMHYNVGHEDYKPYNKIGQGSGCSAN